MNLASKIILAFLIIFAMVFFYLAMYVLDLRGWQKLAQTRQATLNRTNAEAGLLRNSDDANARTKLMEFTPAPPTTPGRKQLKYELENRMVDRGRMWIGNAAATANTPGAPLLFTVQPNPVQPTPLTLAPKTSLYVFEYPPFTGDTTVNAPPGRYLGEFVVLDAPPVDPAGGKFAMAPARSMSVREQTRLGTALQSGMPWVAYETLPQDRHNAFAGLTAEQIAEKFPGVFTQPQLDEIVLDGQPWEQGKHPEDRKDSLEKYRRPLVDFGQMLQSLYRRRSELSAELAALEKDLGYMTASNADVTKQITHRKDEVVTLQQELARLEAENKLVQEHLAAVDAKLASVRATSTRLDADNRKLVAQLASLQRQAVDAAATETAAATP